VNKHETKLHDMLTTLSKCAKVGDGLAYDNPYAFALAHGRWFEPKRLPAGTRLGAPKCCFANALYGGCMINPGWRYVEGYAMNQHGLIPVNHAWNIDASGRLFDITWRNVGLAYFGIEFSTGRADDATWNGQASVLEDNHRKHPLLREPWTGEDFARVWPETEAMQHFRKLSSRK